MKRAPFHFILFILIFIQPGQPGQLGAGPRMHPSDPMNRYEADTDSMEAGATVGAALYVTSKLLGQTIGDTKFAKSLRDNLPFMSHVIPPKGWLGWKEETLDLLGMSTLGAGVGSFGASGELAHQFQFGMSDAVTHLFLGSLVDAIRKEDLTESPSFIDLAMVKVSSQIVRDELIPAGIPPFRGKTKDVLILNGSTEITASAFMGMLEGAALGALYTEVREPKVPLRKFLKRQMITGAAVRGLEAVGTVVYFGPRVHVSESEKEKIEAYARERGVDIRWALNHAQFRDGRYSNYKQNISSDSHAAAWDRHIMLPHKFNPRNNEADQYAGAHEAYHLQQIAETPNWIYLSIRHPEFYREATRGDQQERIHEKFPYTLENDPPPPLGSRMNAPPP